MITQQSVLVQLIRLVERIPSPPPPSARRPRGRPIFYPEKLFLKALVIMIIREGCIEWESSWRSSTNLPPR